MKLLVIGGTHFVGRAMVEDAVARGHDVTVFHRGPAEPERFPEVEHVHGDRDGGLDPLRGQDVGRGDRHVRLRPARGAGLRATARRRGRRPTCSSRRSRSIRTTRHAGGTEASPTRQPPFPDTEEITAESYGGLKVACELEAQDRVPRDGASSSGPGTSWVRHDPSDRFTYWVRRAAGRRPDARPRPAGPAAAGRRRPRPRRVHARSPGGGDGRRVRRRRPARAAHVGPGAPGARGGRAGRAPSSRGWTRRSCGTRVKEEDGELPLWDIDYPGLHSFDASKAIAAGLRHRPLTETIADTLAWDRGRGALKVGLTPERERALLQAVEQSRGAGRRRLASRRLGRAHHPLQHVDPACERAELVGGERPEARRQGSDALRATLPQRPDSLRGGARTITARPSSGSGWRATYPSRSMPSTRRVMVGGSTCSASASSPTRRGPAKTSTDSAESRGAEIPSASSSTRRRRNRWIAAECRRSATASTSRVGEVGLDVVIGI